MIQAPQNSHVFYHRGALIIFAVTLRARLGYKARSFLSELNNTWKAFVEFLKDCKDGLIAARNYNKSNAELIQKFGDISK